MSASSTVLRRAFPLLLLLVAIGAALAVYFLRGGPDRPRDGSHRPPGSETPAPAETGAPEWLSPEDRDALLMLRGRLRESLGEDTDAAVRLRSLLPDDGARAVEYLAYLRPELDLAIRSGQAGSGRAVLDLVAAALRLPGDEARRLVESSAFRELTGRALDAASEDLRAAGVRFLGVVGGPAARARAAGMLADESPRVRGAAVAVYASLTESGGAARLADLYDGEEHVEVRTEILRAFGSRKVLRTPRARAIEGQALAEGQPAERLQALESLAVHQDHDAIEQVTALLASDSLALRKGALDALTRLLDPRAAPALREMVEKEPDPALKSRAKALLKRIE